MELDALEDRLQDPLLCSLQSRHGRGDVPQAAALFPHREALVVSRRRHPTGEREKAELADGDAHGLRKRCHVSQDGKPGFLELLLVALFLLETAGDAHAQVDDLALLATLPGVGTLLPLSQATLFRLLALLPRRLHALLARFSLERIDVSEPSVLTRQRIQLTLQLATSAYFVRRIRGVSTVRRPKAEADHLLEDHLLLRGLANAVVELLTCGHALGGGAAKRNSTRPTERPAGPS